MSTVVALLLISAGLVAEPEKRTWMVAGTPREALVVIPDQARSQPTALIFDYHGHGGTMRHAANRHALHKNWPDAIVVYPQGLPTKTPNDPEGKRSGWQLRAGTNDNRDLAFFDEMLKSLKQEFRVDEKRIFVTGHSNGGGMTYLLWAERGENIAAVASVAAGAGVTVLSKLQPKPCLHIAGEKDPLVRFENQQRVMNAIKKRNGVGKEGQEWQKYARLYESKNGAPFVEVIHPGGHEYPEFASKMIVEFFQKYPKQ